MITRWLNQDTGHSSGEPPTTPIRIIKLDYESIKGGWETVVYVETEK